MSITSDAEQWFLRLWEAHDSGRLIMDGQLLPSAYNLNRHAERLSGWFHSPGEVEGVLWEQLDAEQQLDNILGYVAGRLGERCYRSTSYFVAGFERGVFVRQLLARLECDDVKPNERFLVVERTSPDWLVQVDHLQRRPQRLGLTAKLVAGRAWMEVGDHLEVRPMLVGQEVFVAEDSFLHPGSANGIVAA